uniref:Amino acid adenylation domain protein n=1 Tax=Pseudomonas putida TaxID=303 RepID=C7T5A4_PSEPU|nr:amino acid adenylation domain protein [Pseudomonas putida]
MLSKVRARPDLSIELKLRDVMARPTIGELSGYTDADVALDPLLLLNSRVAGARPLFCLHAGFGTVFDYEPLARRLEGHCSVYGVQCRMLLDRNWQDDSLQAMAIDYAQYIRQKQAEGPYQLAGLVAGWHAGGAGGPGAPKPRASKYRCLAWSTVSSPPVRRRRRQRTGVPTLAAS